MTKVAVFCEGETEQRFCQRLFEEILGDTCEVQLEKVHGRVGRRYLERRYQREIDGQIYVIRIFDCGGGGGESVVSDILELYPGFIGNHGYSFIIGVRDVFPLPRERMPAFFARVRTLIPTKPFPDNDATITCIFSIMEMEAWFLAEHLHFCKIAPELTLEAIRFHMNFDPSVDDMQLRNHPAADLARIYRLVGTEYDIERTVALLDMNRMYLELPQRYAPLKALVETIERIYAVGMDP
jgi:hypothetical protein